MQPELVEAKCVLVVDDDAWLRPVLAELLEDEGYNVLEAASGREALHMIYQQCPDIVLLDAALPWRSGLSILEELKADDRTRRLPIILISGEVDLVETGHGRSATAALHKPLDLGVLLSKVALTVRRAA